MTQRRNRKPSGIGRIERKCDRILSELMIIRNHLVREAEIDDVLDKIHTTARHLRKQAMREKEIITKVLCSTPGRP